MPMPELPVWRDENGDPVACTEKIKVMPEFLTELHQAAQDAFEDALLMGCAEGQVRDYLAQLVASLHNPYRR